MVTACGIGYVGHVGTRRKYTGNYTTGESKTRLGRLLPGRTHKYQFGGPSQRGKSIPFFDNGLCFCVESGKDWFIYNDTPIYEMHVTMWFGAEVGVLARDRTAITRDENELVAAIVVYPQETVPFLTFSSSKVTYRRLEVNAQRLTREYVEKVNSVVMARLKREMCKVSQMFSRQCTEEELLFNCCHNKVMYIDPMFEPNAASVQHPHGKRRVEDVEKITWKRAVDCVPEELHGDIQLFCGDILPQDIHQGMLANCWFICALTLLASRPSLVKDMFCHPVSSTMAREEQKYGAYRVTINKHGWWENVIVDNYLPTVECQPVFARSSGGLREMWVPLVEKAYAKLHGSYSAIIGGHSLHALQDLTGFPVYSFETIWQPAVKDATAGLALFRKFREYRKKGFLIAVSTSRKYRCVFDVDKKAQESSAESLEKEYEAVGLRTGHSYSVLDVQQFSYPNVKLVKMRDPLGKRSPEWTGAWGLSCPRWEKYPLVRLACEPSAEYKGTFWMEWEDVLRFFAAGGVCMVKKNWFDYRVRGVFSGLTPNVVLEVTVTRKTEAFLVLSQRDNCGLLPGDPDARYKSLLINVLSFSREKGSHVVHANSSPDPTVSSPDSYVFVTDRDVGMQISFLPEHSPYYVIPCVMENDAETLKTFTLGLLTQRKVGSGGMQVNFRRLPETHNVLSGAPEFIMNTTQPQCVEFQCKKPGAPAVLYMGDSVQGAKKLPSPLAENKGAAFKEHISSCTFSPVLVIVLLSISSLIMYHFLYLCIHMLVVYYEPHGSNE